MDDNVSAARRLHRPPLAANKNQHLPRRGARRTQLDVTEGADQVRQALGAVRAWGNEYTQQGGIPTSAAQTGVGLDPG